VATTIGEDQWRAFKIDAGSEVTEVQSDIVQLVTVPLKRKGIFVFYASSFASDFILVPETKFEEASAVVERLHSNDLKNNTFYAPSDSSTDLQHFLSVPRRKLSILSFTVVPVRFERFEIPIFFEQLIRWLFFSSITEVPFFQFVRSEEGVGLLVPLNLAEQFPSDRVTKGGVWQPFQRGDKIGFREVGVIVSLSRPLIRVLRINTLYVSTFSSGFIMVPENLKEDAISCLLEHGVDIQEEGFSDSSLANGEI